MSQDAQTSPVAAPLAIDREAHAALFDRRPFRITQGLVDEPLLQLPALLELCRALPAARVEYNAGELPLTVDPTLTPGNGLSAEETLARIRDCRSWLVLKYVEGVPAYRALLDRCVDATAHAAGVPPESFFKRAGFVFVSSPGSVTPLHIDPENNFLLQISGRKSVSVYDRADRRVLSERDLERFAGGGHRNLATDPRTGPAPERFELAPGDGLHVPMHAPHFVENGDEVSISFSITFQTEASDRAHAVYWTNDKLRRLGLRPRPPGASPRSDALKYGIFRRLRDAKRALRRRD